MSIVNIYFVPHPPIIMNEIGGRDVNNVAETIEAYHKVARLIAVDQPDTIIFITPHGMSFENGTSLYDDMKLRGDFEMFGSPEIEFHKNVNQELTKRIEASLEQEEITSILVTPDIAKQYNRTLKLDHGVMVPMYFIDQYYQNYDIVSVTPGNTSLIENYRIGMLLRMHTDSSSSCVLVCSGDLSHALKNSGPYAFHKNGPQFDQVVREAVINHEVEKLLTLPEDFVENAAQCGLRSFLMGFGALDGYEYTSELYSYEGPFGVGYMLARLTPLARSESFFEKYETNRKGKYFSRLSEETLYVTLARKTISHYLNTRRTIKAEEFKQYVLATDIYHYTAEEIDTFIDALESQKKGCFVSIHKNNHLRGCMGTIEPALSDLYDEITYNAIIASTEDPRFNEIDFSELEDLEISVDVLMPIEAVTDFNAFDVKRYGMIVEKGRKRGLLLPNLDGIDDVETQYRICLEKAGIYIDQEVKLYRFEVIRHR